MDKKKNPSKKETRHLIEQQISTSLADLKVLLGEKEFESRVKKAAKIFAKKVKTETIKEKAAAPTEKKTPQPKKAAALPTAKKAKKAAVKK